MFPNAPEWELPPMTGWIALVLLLGWSAFWTFHELRSQERKGAKSIVDDLKLAREENERQNRLVYQYKEAAEIEKGRRAKAEGDLEKEKQLNQRSQGELQALTQQREVASSRAIKKKKELSGKLAEWIMKGNEILGAFDEYSAASPIHKVVDWIYDVREFLRSEFGTPKEAYFHTATGGFGNGRSDSREAYHALRDGIKALNEILNELV